MTDIGVIGAGIIGLATAYALHERGASVTVYEPAQAGSGQSAGHSRIFRHAHDDARMVQLAARSRAIWRQWERDFDTTLISPGGAVALGEPVAQKKAILDRFSQVPARWLEPGDLATRLPLLAHYEGPAMLDETGGAIDTRTAVSALAGHVQPAMVCDEVLGLRSTGSGRVELRTHTGVREHDHVVVAAGVGSAALAAGLGIELPLRVASLVRVTFAVRDSAPAPLPTLQDSSGAFGETGVYATAYPGDEYYSVGLGDDVDVTVPGGTQQLAALAERTCRYVENALPGVDPTPVGHVHCRITELGWHADGMGLWQSGQVSVLAGHNLFKQAPALGQDLADVALGAPVPPWLTPAAQLGAPQPG